jgi:hypothetical protein
MVGRGRIARLRIPSGLSVELDGHGRRRRRLLRALCWDCKQHNGFFRRVYADIPVDARGIRPMD